MKKTKTIREKDFVVRVFAAAEIGKKSVRKNRRSEKKSEKNRRRFISCGLVLKTFEARLRGLVLAFRRRRMHAYSMYRIEEPDKNKCTSMKERIAMPSEKIYFEKDRHPDTNEGSDS